MVNCSLCKTSGHNKRTCKQPKCSICLDIVQKTDMMTFKCGHTFHMPCGLKWLKHNNTCPYCRLECNQSFPLLKGDVIEDILTENIYIKDIIIDTINFHQTFFLFPWMFAINEEKTDEEKKEIWNGYSLEIQTRLISLILSNVIINTSHEFGMNILEDVKTFQEK